MPIEYVSPSKGKFQSLSGSKGDYLVWTSGQTECAAGFTEVLKENANRVFAVLKLIAPATPQDQLFQLAPPRDFDTLSMEFNEDDIVVIDSEHPWCGAVSIQVAVAAPNVLVDWYEVSVV